MCRLETTNGKLFRASSWLATPEHSHHSIDDFGIGKTGVDERIFTADYRYSTDNLFGVIFETWHIKID